MDALWLPYATIRKTYVNYKPNIGQIGTISL